MKKQSLSIKRVLQFVLLTIRSNPFYLLYFIPAFLITFFYGIGIQIYSCPWKPPFFTSRDPAVRLDTLKDQLNYINNNLMHPAVYPCKEAFLSLVIDPANFFFVFLNTSILFACFFAVSLFIHSNFRKIRKQSFVIRIIEGVLGVICTCIIILLVYIVIVLIAFFCINFFFHTLS